MREVVVFSGSAHRRLARSICAGLGVPLSRADITRFSNDCLEAQLQANCRQRDVYVVQPLVPPTQEHLMELLLMLDAARGASAAQVTAVIPHFAYARSDKKDASRISLGGRLVADLLVAAGATKVLTMTLHAPQVHGFFSVPTDHLLATPILVEYFEQLGLEGAVVVAPDAGHAKRAGEFAQRLKLPIAFVDKRRLSDTKVQTSSVVGDVRGKNCLIVDDEIAAGSTTISTMNALLEAGARDVYAAATHGVLCGPAIERLKSSGLQKIAVTNTVAVPQEKQFERLQVLSVAPLFGAAIRSVHTGESVSALF